VSNTDTHQEQLEHTLKFMKEAFCVDGEAELVTGKFESSCAVKLTDSERGTFFVSVTSEAARV
jgi:hypothetical protein